MFVPIDKLMPGHTNTHTQRDILYEHFPLLSNGCGCGEVWSSQSQTSATTLDKQAKTQQEKMQSLFTNHNEIAVNFRTEIVKAHS